MYLTLRIIFTTISRIIKNKIAIFHKLFFKDNYVIVTFLNLSSYFLIAEAGQYFPVLIDTSTYRALSEDNIALHFRFLL